MPGQSQYIVRREPDYGVEMVLRMLKVRRLVEGDDNAIRPIESEQRVLAFYANSIAHLVEASTGEPVAESAAR